MSIYRILGIWGTGFPEDGVKVWNPLERCGIIRKVRVQERIEGYNGVIFDTTINNKKLSSDYASAARIMKK